MFIFLIIATPTRSFADEQADAPPEETENSAENAGDETDSVPDLEEVVVRSVAPNPGVKELPRQDIEKRKSADAVDVLETLPSVYADTGSRGERIFSLRGFDQRQTVVLIDGLPAYIPADGQMDLRMIPAEMIDHITVAPGPASILYGPNGLGGAVNIVTRRPGTDPFVQAALEAGTPKTFSERAVVSFKKNSVGALAAGGITTSEGFSLPESFSPTTNETHNDTRTNSDRRTGFALANTAIELGGGRNLKTSLFYIDGQKGAPPSTEESVPKLWRFDPWRAVGASLGLEIHKKRFHADVAAYGRFFENTLKAYDDLDYFSQDHVDSYKSTYRDFIAGSRARMGGRLWPLPGGDTRLRLWLQGQYDRHGQQPDKHEDWEINSRGLFTIAPEIEAYPFRKLSITAGVQNDIETPLEQPSDYDGKTTTAFGPLLSLRYFPVQVLSLSLTGARRSRFPTLHERFAESGSRILPNPDLQPETAWHGQLAVNGNLLQRYSIEVAAWAAQVQDLIEYKNLGEGNRRMENTDRARLAGVDANVGMKPWDWISLRGGYAYLYARRIEENGDTGDVENKPEHKATGELTLMPIEILSLSNFLEYVGERKYEDPDLLIWDTLPAYYRWDAVLEFTPVPELEIWIKAENILDSLYETQYGFPDPGRTYRAGIRVRFP